MRYRAAVIIFLAALAAFRAAYVIYTPFGLSPDEAHYWEWSRRLALSYYSKGPGVAYAIAFFTSIFGDTAFGVRIGAVIFSALASYLVYLSGREFFGSERAGAWGAVILNITPIFSIGSILMTTDVLFLFFWVGALICIKKALDGDQAWWYMAGLVSGLGFLSKYTIVLLAPCLLLFLFFSGGLKELKRPGPYAASFIFLIVITPVIYWNILNGQVTIRHTMGQAHMGSGAFSIGAPFEFLAAQAAIVSPLLLIGFIYGIYRCLRSGGGAPLFAFYASAPVFIFFLLAGLHGKVQANWAIASYALAAPASVRAFDWLYKASGDGARRALKGAAVFALALGAIISVLAYFPWALEPLGAKRIMWSPPYNRVTGWQELGKKVSEVRDAMGPKAFIMSDTYQITSELAFYTEGRPVVYNVDAGTRRMNQYDLWPGFEGLKGYNAVYVKGGTAGPEEAVLAAFDRCDKEVFTVYRRGAALKEFALSRCYNFKGMEKKAKAAY